MIPAISKFPLRTDYLSFRSKAKRLVAPHLTIFYLKSLSTPPRLSVIVPKKLSKLATTRNWLKRLTYDVLFLHLNGLSLDLIVVYKPLSLKKSPLTKAQVVHELLSTIKTL
jgi:ribonuclease P protein component